MKPLLGSDLEFDHLYAIVFIMTRPLRLEFPGAVYHVMSRGDNKQKIFLNDHDRRRFLKIYQDVVERQSWMTYAWCLMDNHFHLVIETPEPNLSEGMRLLNGIYTQYFNANKGRVGHVFQGRFHSIVVDENVYLLELVRYVVLNPVRSGRVDNPGKWPWSSYKATAGLEPCPPWLNADAVTDAVSERIGTRRDRQKSYADFILKGMGRDEDLMEKVQQQVYLGDEEFIVKVQDRCSVCPELADIAREQKRKPLASLEEYFGQYPHPKEAMAMAYLEGKFSQAEISRHLGVHYSTVSRAVREYKKKA